MSVILFILSIIITIKICSWMNQNTIGTMRGNEQVKTVKKMHLFLIGFFFMCTFTGCALPFASKLQEAFEGDTEKENIEERIVILGVEYDSRLFGGKDDNTEITLYLDDMEIGNMNCGDANNFEVSLPLGEHEIKVTRNMLDKDKCTFNVEKVDDMIFSEQYVAFKYTYHSLTSNGELEETDFSYVSDANYVYIDVNDANVNEKELDESKSVDLSEIILKSENGKQLVDKLKTQYDVEFIKSADSDEYEYMSDRLYVSGDEENFNIIIERAYDPIYVFDGIWCGMNAELAQETLKKISDENYGYTLMEEIYSVRIGDDLVGILCNGGKVRGMIYMKKSNMLKVDEEGEW